MTDANTGRACASLIEYEDHADCFDRLWVAQGLTEPMIRLTTDDELARYGPTVRVL